MKKLFLILVSVLVLGGCSVDDDISVSGGGVSSGGDDMAITTYPNVVEASRTVVEGGYLVDYVVVGKISVLEIEKLFYEKLGMSKILDFEEKSLYMFDVTCPVGYEFKKILVNGVGYEVVKFGICNYTYVAGGTGQFDAPSFKDISLDLLCTIDKDFQPVDFFCLAPADFVNSSSFPPYSYKKIDWSETVSITNFGTLNGTKNRYSDKKEIYGNRLKFTIFEPSK